VVGVIDARHVPLPVGGRVEAQLAGAIDNAHLRELVGGVQVRSPEADFTGRATSEGDAVAIVGRATAKLDELRRFADVGATGSMDASLRVLAGTDRIVTQIPKVRFSHATVRGVPLHAAEGTVILRNGNYELPALRVEAGGGHLVAGGRLDAGGSVTATVGTPL